jgi:prevent-host-death family protein
MEELRVGITELQQRLSDVIRAVEKKKAIYIVERYGQPQVAIINVDDYRWLRGQPQAMPPLDELARAAFGMWHDRDDVDDEWLMRTRQHWHSTIETESS